MGFGFRKWPLYQALAFSRWPKEFLRSLQDQQGDGFLFSLPGLGRIHVTGTARGAREIFSAPYDTFTRLQNSPVEPILGPESLMLVAGKRHLEERKALSVPFRGESMLAYGDSIVDDTCRHLESALGEGRFVVQDLARRIALDVIIGCVFGVQEPARKALFHRAISRMMDRYITPLMVLPFLRFGFWGLSPWDRFCQARSRVHLLFREEFQVAGEGRVDILGRLLAMEPRPGEEALLSLLCTRLVAGHDTSAIGLTWALYFLHSQPQALERLRAELQQYGSTPEQLVKAPYLKAVCQETFRLNPSVPASVRRLARPLVLAGQELPAGSNVAVALTLLHSDPTVYEDPDKFRPERFLDHKYSPFEYAPFGGGYRRCIGETFATFEMTLVLGTILSRASLSMPPQPRPRAVINGIAMGPSRAVFLESD